MDWYVLAKKNLTAIGIANVDAIEFNHLKGWLDKGFHGQMGWITRNIERRCDPRLVLPGCKSMIVCAMKHDDIHEDYHKVMMKKLEFVVAAIREEHPETQCKCYVDTGPVLEKAWGVRAGLGFIGKNTLLISPEYGSQMALGVVLTDVEVRSQKPEIRCLTSDFRFPASICGSCRKCLDACPTGALVAPYILDARKCISYKFFISKEKGGCDICQDVCPFNKPDVIARNVSDEAIP
jgi:epoxyqueuosine reductase